MSVETYRFNDHLKSVFDDIVVLKKLLSLAVTTWFCVKLKVKVGFLKVNNFKWTIFSYAAKSLLIQFKLTWKELILDRWSPVSLVMP